MESVGIFEAKAKLSEICEQVAVSGQPVLITRRGQPLVRILPIETQPASIIGRRDIYLAQHESEIEDDCDFEPPLRSREVGHFELP